MQENKPTSLAITVVILLCMFHSTLIILLFSMGLMLIGLDNPMYVFYYLIDYTLPITFLVSLLDAVRIEDNIFLKKTTKRKTTDDQGLIIATSTYSMLVTFAVIFTSIALKNISELGIFIFHVFIFGGTATYVFVNVAIKPLLNLINNVIGFFTNWIFNKIFAKHLRLQTTP